VAHAAGHQEPRERFLQRKLDHQHVLVRQLRGLLHGFFGATLGFPRALDVDLAGGFAQARKDRDAVRKDFDDSIRGREKVRPGGVLVRNLADSQPREKRGVAGQDAEVTVDPGTTTSLTRRRAGGAPG
jgi:hypothetical protein